MTSLRPACNLLPVYRFSALSTCFMILLDLIVLTVVSVLFSAAFLMN